MQACIMWTAVYTLVVCMYVTVQDDQQDGFYLLRSRLTKALAASEMSCQALPLKDGSCVRMACLQCNIKLL